MNRVEFIGAPYVGKSFLFQKLNTIKGSANANWIVERQVIRLARKEMGYLNYIYRKVFQLMGKKLGYKINIYAFDKLRCSTINDYNKTIQLCFEKKDNPMDLCLAKYTFDRVIR